MSNLPAILLMQHVLAPTHRLHGLSKYHPSLITTISVTLEILDQIRITLHFTVAHSGMDRGVAAQAAAVHAGQMHDLARMPHISAGLYVNCTTIQFITLASITAFTKVKSDWIAAK